MFSGVFTLIGDVLLKPVIEAAGKDISHWFDKKTKDVSIMLQLLNSVLEPYFFIFPIASQ